MRTYNGMNQIRAEHFNTWYINGASVTVIYKTARKFGNPGRLIIMENNSILYLNRCYVLADFRF